MPRIRSVAILQNPALAGNIPTPAAWLQPQFSFTGTSSNGSSTVSSITSPYVPANWSTTGPILPGTNTLLFGPGFPLTGTTVATVASVNSITAAVNATTALGAGTGVFTVASVNPSQSAFAGNWPGYTLPPVTGDTPVGCLYEIPFIVTVANLFSTSAVPVPPGDVFISLTNAGTSAVVLQAYQGPTPSWVTIHSFGTVVIVQGLYVPSDGANLRLLIPANVPTTLNFYQFR